MTSPRVECLGPDELKRVDTMASRAPSYRLHGSRPYRVAVVHGGPGAPGSVAAVARELSSQTGVVEPFQTANSVNGQALELRSVLAHTSQLPVVLVGHSWGAWLSLITAAINPGLVGKLILVSSGGFLDEYGKDLQRRRIRRLSLTERREYLELTSGETIVDPDRMMERLGELVSKTDSYDLLVESEEERDRIPVRGDVFDSVWSEAASLRASGQLLDLAGTLTCPVVAIHGKQDPHPEEGVRIPLAQCIPSFRFYSLDKCGHYPWRERHARARFFEILVDEIGGGPRA